jgi:hypothetical protein
MIKAIVFFTLGMGAMYLYQNPGDFDGMLDAGKGAINQAGQLIVDSTK